jgi:hypothetical protein
MHILRRLTTPITRLWSWTAGQLQNHLVPGESLQHKPVDPAQSLDKDWPLDKQQQDTPSGQESLEQANLSTDILGMPSSWWHPALHLRRFTPPYPVQRIPYVPLDKEHHTDLGFD